MLTTNTTINQRVGPTACNVLANGFSGHLRHVTMFQLPGRGYTPIGIDIKESARMHHIGSVSYRRFAATIMATDPGLRYTFHTAIIHKPHVKLHLKEGSVNTNAHGTLSVVPIPKNNCGTSKVVAEVLYQLLHNEIKMPVLVSKSSRILPEQDNNEVASQASTDDNLNVNELMYHRAAFPDVVDAHGKYVINAPPPFPRDPAMFRALDVKAAWTIKATRSLEAEQLLPTGWELPNRIDHVYGLSTAIKECRWRPRNELPHTKRSMKIASRRYNDIWKANKPK
ncbi:hypothetical protein DOTSEDRAFT_61885 [Dothistroma septosporum NZE10]|uniref:Uncharacterized protein n=1 Tax=Dothistroma septosporum (strain NZE10 / CBS 128990) TaxID=675120 RepID=N1PPN9_DOTSN|nr:hypothetical protein DOTSEDRAFT_61885 [Dothistroma septosporum NZE10]